MRRRKPQATRLTGLQALAAAQKVSCMVCENEVNQGEAKQAPRDGWWVCLPCVPKINQAAAAREKEAGHA